jgi:GntR family transcriptional regulator
MARAGVESIPAYRRIHNSIRERIEAGDLNTGDAVSSERELARIHGVSLMTARHALATLEREGMVERRRGVGTFVAAPRIHFNKLMSYTEEMASRGLSVSSKILDTCTVNDEQEVAARLALPPLSCLIKIERLRRVADEPFALETVYLSAEEFPDLVTASLENESLFAFLKRTHSLELAHADEVVDATGAEATTAKLLGISRGAPLLRIRQVIFSTKAKPVMYVQGLYRADRHNLVIRRFR